MMNKMYAIGQLKAVPLNRAPLKDDIVQWVNSLQESFYATITSVNADEAEFRNYYPTDNPYYCFSTDKLDRLIVLSLVLVNENGQIGTVSKNIKQAFLKNEIKLNESVWYEIKHNSPRIHKKNLICK